MAGREGSTPDKLRYGFRLCLARPPSAKELARLEQFYGDALGAIHGQTWMVRKSMAGIKGQREKDQTKEALRTGSLVRRGQCFAESG